MATGNRAVWKNMENKLKAMGGVKATKIGEPRTAVQTGLVAIIPADGEYDESTLGAPREIHRAILRMHANWQEEPEERAELMLDQFRADIMQDIAGDFDLGGTVGYLVPNECKWAYDVLQIENTLYRIIDVMVGYRVDDRASYVA